MPLPPSFAKEGFLSHDLARKRMKLKSGRLLKPLMIGTEGGSDSGKTEFLLSCPGPGIIICLDRGFDPIFDNPNQPPTRRDDFAFKSIEVPLNTTATQSVYVDYFKLCRDEFYKALSNPDALTVAMDGDSDFFELQTLAEFGKVKEIWPQTRWGDLYAKRRAITARCHDSGKIVIGTNKLKDEYVTVYKPDGSPEIDPETKKEKRVKSGLQERQGFKDQDYLWNVQLRHLYEPPRINKVTGKEMPAQWGIRVVKFKSNPPLVGLELWGADCCFSSLVQTIYPNVDPAEWGL